jgi:hypothetical protein
MKTVIALLLGTAAGLVATTASQAADIPVKAKPVQYVKVCSLYGDGFYYIPGTDTCLKFGGYIRVEANLHAGQGAVVNGSGAAMIQQALYNRVSTNDVNYRIRGLIALDVRQQTEYGTLRNYMRVAWDQTTPQLSGIGTTPCNNLAANSCLGYWDRAFIQFAGFTVGKSNSAFDLFTFYSSLWSYLGVRTTGDTSFFGANVFLYSVQFGNGVSATVGLEDPLSHFKANTFDLSVPGFWAINGVQVNDNGFNMQAGQTFNSGFRTPDITANARVDRSWGLIGVSVAAHDASGGYYATPNNVNNGHPADKFGWAASIGGQLNLQGGDQAGATFVWSKGASGYASDGIGVWQIYNASTSVGVGWGSDGVWDLPAGSDIELTTAWSINAAYQHVWNPKWRTSVYGGYVDVSYSAFAQNLINSRLPGVCQAPAAAALGIAVPAATFGVGAAGPLFTALPGNSCNPNFSFYQVGTRTQYNPVTQLDIGLDITYTKLNTAYKGPASYGPNLPRPIVGFIDDQNVWSFVWRWQRNFYPG